MKELSIPKITAEAVSVFFKDRKDEYEQYKLQYQAEKEFYLDLIDNHLDKGIYIEHSPSLRTGNYQVFTITRAIEDPNMIRFSRFMRKPDGVLIANNHTNYNNSEELFENEFQNIKSDLETQSYCFIESDNELNNELER